MPRGHSVREAVNEREIYDALVAATYKHGAVVAFAHYTGIGREYLHRMLDGKQRVSAEVARRLGFELRWVRKEQAKP